MAKDVVISVSFSPKRKRPIAELKLDPQRFKKVVDEHVVRILYYINDEEGITYEVQSGKVESVEYGPTKKDEHLRCQPQVAPGSTSGEPG